MKVEDMVLEKVNVVNAPRAVIVRAQHRRANQKRLVLFHVLVLGACFFLSLSLSLSYWRGSRHPPVPLPAASTFACWLASFWAMPSTLVVSSSIWQLPLRACAFGCDAFEHETLTSLMLSSRTEAAVVLAGLL
jgi:hypothetical protein